MKSESVTDITNVRKKATKTQKERTLVTSVREIQSAELDKLFEMPKCRKMDDDEVQDNTLELLSVGKIML